MPWEVSSVAEQRAAVVHAILVERRPVAAVCRDYGVSRPTAYKWLRRHRAQPAALLADQSRRPHRSPGRTTAAVEDVVLAARDRWGWGPRKLHAWLVGQGVALPSARTVGAILARHGRTAAAPAARAPLQRFERGRPNELWQVDHKGCLEVGRRRVWPLTVLDDHSRFLLALRPCADVRMATAWAALWAVFGEYGLPEALLCDNAFGVNWASHLGGLSWWESRLLRLGIRTLHGRPHHPQTQGKVERLHRTLEDEAWPRARRDTLAHFTADVEAWRTGVYNPVRPHEALGDVPPAVRYARSDRPRPARLPPLAYPPGAVLRQVRDSGDLHWRGYRLLAGRGIVGERVRVAEEGADVVLYYGDHPFRRIATSTLHRRGLQ